VSGKKYQYLAANYSENQGVVGRMLRSDNLRDIERRGNAYVEVVVKMN